MVFFGYFFMGFSSKLRELRNASGLTQGQLAEKVGLSKSGLAYLEQGLREPGWGTVRALAKALGVSCEAFDVGDDPTDAPQGRGRPPKAKDTASSPEPKRGRGRPRNPPEG